MVAIKTKERKNKKTNGYSYHAEYLIEGTQCSFLIGYVMLKGETNLPTKFSEGLMAQGETGGEYSVKVVRMDKDRYQFTMPHSNLSDLNACKNSLEQAELMKEEIEKAVQDLLQKERL